MADENIEGNPPRNTSEATPPHVDDSPEMVSQPPTPEEERVTSSTDRQPPEAADSPDEQRVSSSSEQQDDGAGPSNREAGQSSQPSPDAPPNPALREILGAPPQSLPRENLVLNTVGDLVRETVNAALGYEIGHKAETKDATKRNTDAKSDDSNQQFDIEDLSPGSKSSENVDLGSDSSPTAICGEDSSPKGLVSGSSAIDESNVGKASSPEVGTVIKAESKMETDESENVSLEGEPSTSKTGSGVCGEDSSPEGLGAGSSATEESSVVKDSSPKIGTVIKVESSMETDVTENVSLESELSASKTGSGVCGEASSPKGLESGSSVTDESSVVQESSPKVGTIIKVESSIETDYTENASLEGQPGSEDSTRDDGGLKRESSPSKASLTVPVSGAGATDNVGSKDKLSPSKTGTSSVEGSSTPEKPRDNVSPKRKSPTNVQHLSPKRSAPFTSTDILEKQSESQMSTLLEELDIDEGKDKPRSPKPASGEEQKSMEMEESEKEETEQENTMEVQETDSQKADDETKDKDPKNDDSGMEN